MGGSHAYEVAADVRIWSVARNHRLRKYKPRKLGIGRYRRIYGWHGRRGLRGLVDRWLVHGGQLERRVRQWRPSERRVRQWRLSERRLSERRVRQWRYCG